MSNQFATFKIGEEQFCIDINKITYIESFQDITQVPNTPEYIEGIINLHNGVVAIYNIHKKFNLPDTTITDDTVFIIVDVGGVAVGLIVDMVNEIITAKDTEIESTPIVIAKDLKYISGIIKKDNDIIMIIDIDKLISLEEQEQISDILQTQ